MFEPAKAKLGALKRIKKLASESALSKMKGDTPAEEKSLMAQESDEHPEFGQGMIKKIVQDHMKKNGLAEEGSP